MTDSIGEMESTTKKRTWAYFYIALLIVLLFIPVLSMRYYAKLIHTSFIEQLPVETADCGLVLTGAAGRIREGISLLSHKRVQKLIISGVHQHSTLGDMFPELLFYPEIKLEDVILERRSSSTEGNAQSSLPIVEALHCHSVFLITSDYHMYRAYKMFKQVFPPTVDIIPYSVMSDRMHKRHALFFDTRYWGTVAEEWVKYLFYSAFVF